MQAAAATTTVTHNLRHVSMRRLAICGKIVNCGLWHFDDVGGWWLAASLAVMFVIYHYQIRS